MLLDHAALARPTSAQISWHSRSYNFNGLPVTAPSNRWYGRRSLVDRTKLELFR
jgi:hypothetical protein